MTNKCYTKMKAGDRFQVSGMQGVGRPNADGEQQAPKANNGDVVEVTAPGVDSVKVRIIQGENKGRELVFAHATGLNKLQPVSQVELKPQPQQQLQQEQQTLATGNTGSGKAAAN